MANIVNFRDDEDNIFSQNDSQWTQNNLPPCQRHNKDLYPEVIINNENDDSKDSENDDSDNNDDMFTFTREQL